MQTNSHLKRRISCIDMMMHIVRLTCIDLILTDSASSISNRVKFSSLLSDFQKLVVSVLKSRSHQICSVKQAILKIFVKSQEKTYARVSFLIKLQAMTWKCSQKEDLTQVFSCEFSIILNVFFIEHLRTTAFENA